MGFYLIKILGNGPGPGPGPSPVDEIIKWWNDEMTKLRNDDDDEKVQHLHPLYQTSGQGVCKTFYLKIAVL